MFMSVDLPAPFSPRSACTSPRRTSNETPSFATTPGNSLRMSRISRTRSSLTSFLRLRFCRWKERAGPHPPSRTVVVFLFQVSRELQLPLDDLGLVGVHQVDPRLRDRRADLADAD